MRYNFNHIKRGAWFIYKKADLDTIYNVLYEFYDRVLIPMCGKMKKFIFVYDLNSGTLKVRECWGFNVLKINLVQEKEFAKELYYTLDKIAATGIVSAPFYLIEIKFDPYSKKNSGKGNILTFSGGTGKRTGYYHLRGVLT